MTSQVSIDVLSNHKLNVRMRVKLANGRVKRLDRLNRSVRINWRAVSTAAHAHICSRQDAHCSQDYSKYENHRAESKSARFF